MLSRLWLVSASNMGALVLEVVLGKVLLEWSQPFENE